MEQLMNLELRPWDELAESLRKRMNGSIFFFSGNISHWIHLVSTKDNTQLLSSLSQCSCSLLHLRERERERWGRETHILSRLTWCWAAFIAHYVCWPTLCIYIVYLQLYDCVSPRIQLITILSMHLNASVDCLDIILACHHVPKIRVH
jgi:hypothetical protein